MKARFLAVPLALMLAGTAAWAQSVRQTCTGGSDNATWSATTNSTSVTTGGTADLSVNMTSPTCLNSYSDFPGTLSVSTDVALGSSMCPDGSSGATATCSLVAPVASITNNPQAYSDFGQTQTYGVHFDATNATAGTYTFHVHANASDGDNQALNGFGWGYGGGTDLTVTVGQPKQGCDINDSLNVAFVSPVNNASVNFCTGGTGINLNINATDTSNLITSLTASVNTTDITNSLAATGLGTQSVNLSGSYQAGKVGLYQFVANAATACTTGSAEADVNLVYVISGLQPPLASGSRPKGGSAAPIKIIPRDCSGSVVPFDNTVHIDVYTSAGALLQDSFYGGCSGTKCGAGGNTSVQYDASSGQYSTIFQTDSGANTYIIRIFFGGVDNLHTNLSTSK